MDRRDFLKSSLFMLGAMSVDWPSFAAKVKTLGEPNLRIGIVSDIHITDVPSAETLRHTFEYFRDRKADGVIMAGDLADWGLESQLQIVADTWFSVFPKDRRPDKEHIEKLFIYGNHDMDGAGWGVGEKHGMTPEEVQRQNIGKHPAEVWKRCFHEKWVPVYLKTVKGYHFVGAHWHDANNVPGLEELLDANADKLKGTKPFFYFQHPHPRNTCNGPWAWGQDDGTVTRLLSRYPNAVAFSGHSHSPLNDERDLWQGAFTSIGTASLRYQYPLGARENTYEDGSREHIPSQMPIMYCQDGRQGMFMMVYDDCITLERREFVHDQPVGDNWIIPLPCTGDAPLSYERRAKEAKVPQFASGDKVTVTRGTGKDRYGTEQKQVTVHFPSVLAKRTGVRAYDYEVQVEYRYIDVTMIAATKRVFSPKCYLGEAQDEGEVICVYGETELPEYRDVRFVVRPCECFGKKGNPIYSDWVKGREG